MINKLLQNNRIIQALLMSVIVFVFLTGCSKKDQPQTNITKPTSVTVQQPVIKPVQRQISSVAMTTAQLHSNLFDFSNKKDPFKPFVVAKAITTPTPADVKNSLKDGLPIHSFDVSQFRLIGIVTGGKDNQAMVVDPNGKGYVLKSGMFIGKNDGKVVAITAVGVDVLEQFKDDNGRVRKENIRITLPRKQ
jgi:type IV pilus assembly protein PilP